MYLCEGIPSEMSSKCSESEHFAGGETLQLVTLEPAEKSGTSSWSRLCGQPGQTNSLIKCCRVIVSLDVRGSRRSECNCTSMDHQGKKCEGGIFKFN